jgi:hypothetical protein
MTAAAIEPGCLRPPAGCVAGDRAPVAPRKLHRRAERGDRAHRRDHLLQDPWEVLEQDAECDESDYGDRNPARGRGKHRRMPKVRHPSFAVSAPRHARWTAGRRSRTNDCVRPSTRPRRQRAAHKLAADLARPGPNSSRPSAAAPILCREDESSRVAAHSMSRNERIALTSRHWRRSRPGCPSATSRNGSDRERLCTAGDARAPRQETVVQDGRHASVSNHCPRAESRRPAGAVAAGHFSRPRKS